jgi:hypothetical protein
LGDGTLTARGGSGRAVTIVGYQFGAAVIGNVTCAWLQDYVTARTTGDEAGMKAVDAAMSTSRKWKVLQQMQKQGDYPWMLWTLAERVAKHQDVGKYRTTLGCD